MAQHSNRKITQMLLAAGALMVVVVAGVSLGLAGGSAQAGNGQSIILGAACSGSGTNCETSGTSITNTASGDGGFGATATSGEAGLAGANTSIGLIPAYGVEGTSTDIGVGGNGAAIGVAGDSTTGIAVEGFSLDGIALEVAGRAQFELSGVATVAGTAASPKNSVRVRMPAQSAPLPVTANSMMFALLQGHVRGVYVVAAVPNVRGNYFTIYLNKAVTTSVGPIAWMVTERP
jgi:hypothetical protein